MKIKKLNLFLQLIFLGSLSFSQTGPAGVGTSATNVLWLKANAGTSSTTNNTRISSWNDQSGNGINVSQVTAVQQPSYTSNVINGMPAIQFDNAVDGTNDKLYAADSPLLDNTPGLSIFTVSGLNQTIASPYTNDARAILSKRNNVGVQESYMLFYYTSNKINVDIEHSTNDRFPSTASYATNTSYITDIIYDGSLTAANRSKLYFGETLDKTATETSAAILDNNSPLNIGTTHDTDPRPFGGYIAEVIIYTVTVNDAQRIIVNNYLSSKYNIALSANDKYAGDAPANGDYDRNVAGIGSEAAGSNTTFSASTTLGLGLTSLSGLGVSDYVLAGHATVTNSVNIIDVSGISGTNPARWERIWYVDVSNSGAIIQANIEFDMVAAGMSGITPVTASNYKLIYRTGTSGSWAEVATANSVSGNKVIFNSYNFNNSDDGYYTLATKNYPISPLPIELIDFTAKLNGKKVDITWSTETEINNDYYVVEKSIDGIHFETLSKVDAAGNSVSVRDYINIDPNPFEGLSYYRLKQVDFNGSFTYSTIVYINYNVVNNIISIFPNPTDGKLTLNIIGLENKEILITITDMTGKECYREVIIKDENNQLIALDLKHQLAAGSYIIQVNSENTRYCRKIQVN
jgi:hypothetical protein